MLGGGQPAAAEGRRSHRRAFLAGAVAFTGTTAAVSVRPAGGQVNPPAAGTPSSSTFLRGDQRWSDSLTGGLTLTGADRPDRALQVGDGVRALRSWVGGGDVQLTSSDGAPLRMGTQTRWDSGGDGTPAAAGFTINRPSTVWRQTAENHKGAMLEFQQWLEAGTHRYGSACTNAGGTFEVPAAAFKRVGWILAHYDSPTAEQHPIHQHMNFETCKADLSTIVTRFQISWGEDVALCSFPNSHVRIYDDRELRIGSGDGVKLRYDPPSARLSITGRPWSWGGAVFVDPRTGRLGVGTSTPAAPVHVQRNGDGNALVVRNTTAAGNSGANIVADAQTPQSRLFHGGLVGDSVKRISIEASGRIEWGPGGAALRDTNLYRRSADTLATDDDLRFDAAGRGPIVRSPNGTAYRITVADDGRLGTVRV